MDQRRYLAEKLERLAAELEGALHLDELHRAIYATDASVYREQPLGVVTPQNGEDLEKVLRFAAEQGVGLIPRAAGTSLAGQCVGNGLVVDVSRHFTEVLELNTEERWVRVQPGVIRDELNRFLQPHGLFFGPNTSTANRAMIGGMVGNNSSGTTSIRYGVTRDHVLQVKALLSDGSEVTFGDLSEKEWEGKRKAPGREGEIYRFLLDSLSDAGVQEKIRKHFPKPEIHRRNTGYALDALLDQRPFLPKGDPLNICKLLAGSEGTLALITEIKLRLSLLPPPAETLLCGHFESVGESLLAVRAAMEMEPYACELMDKVILDCTRGSRAHEKNRFFVEGDPAAILVVELRGKTQEEADALAERLREKWKEQRLGYAYPLVKPPLSRGVWELRKAGLGLLSNMPGDARPVACIEDTAVALDDLPAYIAEFEKLMEGFGQRAVYYAHAGAGELHLRPILDLKKEPDRQLFREITRASALLVKKYRGSLSGEHGDGRVRAAYIPDMMGEEIYQLFRELKQVWDPQGILNPGKIVDAPPMDEDLRYEVGQETRTFDTVLDFSRQGGILRAAEKCNGSGDCRKLHSAGGVMCPSYHATRDEKDTTRARANALREFLTRSDRSNPFSHEELREVMDLCISCKGCTGECPSDVDMAGLKAEFLHQYYKDKPRPLRDRFFAESARLNALAARVPALSNAFLQNGLTGGWVKKMLGVAPRRSLPQVHDSLRKWYRRWKKDLEQKGKPKGQLYLFCDEFTNYLDVEVGKAAIRLLSHLGYEVELVAHPESGRAALSKGFLEKARKLAEAQVRIFHERVSEEVPLVGLEPSALLGFRDEYPRLVRPPLREGAEQLAGRAFLLEEFLLREVEAGRIGPGDFTDQPARVLLHGHCHQKSLASAAPTALLLGLPENYSAELIPAGCCGMAGSFGYEKEHYEISMQIGELSLFPALRKAPAEVILAAPGTSCRHQIFDGTGRQALHPAQVLWEAVKR